MAETIVSSIPASHAFDPRTTTWQSYRNRIGFYFKANRIMEDSDKKPLFLWAIGDSTFNLLESLMSPTALTDTTITFETLTKVLDSHYDIRKNIMTSTYDFYSCVQKPGQSFIEWKAELREKVRHCGFTTSKLAKKPQDRALRDMYVIGIRRQKTRQALLKEEDPDLEATEKIIQMAECLQEDVRHFNANTGQTDGNVDKIDRQQSSETPRQQTRSHWIPTVSDPIGSGIGFVDLGRQQRKRFNNYVFINIKADLNRFQVKNEKFFNSRHIRSVRLPPTLDKFRCSLLSRASITLCRPSKVIECYDDIHESDRKHINTTKIEVFPLTCLGNDQQISGHVKVLFTRVWVCDFLLYSTFDAVDDD
ncbi:unnamed protein product [Adineta ricciae]|uniref:Uncharacterized protein n=1 Tax=Adineta ricciae TaxID=249248 RepID=A0A815GJN4_ADIRI|nr:unnamed protein product [Adineta ricciae]